MMYANVIYIFADIPSVDATISFGNGLSVAWNGQTLGTMHMDDVNIVGDVGANLSVQTTFEVADVNVLAVFTKVLLNEESFQWQISGENLTGKTLINADELVLISINSQCTW